MIYLSVFISILLSLVLTPLVMKIARKYRVVDLPNERKVHKKEIPLMGGLAIYVSFLVSLFILQLDHLLHIPILLSSLVIVITGILDDIFNITPWQKLLGQFTAASIIIFGGDVTVTFINLPWGGILEFGILSIPITYLWIIGVTNAINLIDGLDGLSAGVSAIALIAMSGMAFLMGDYYVLAIAILLVGSILGFLPYNFHPAKIFMGDTGALFLGFMISVLSLLGFKNITFISFIVPILILGVPLSDTIFAIIRRIVNKKPIGMPDKSHLHHCLLNLGFTHRQTVILIYATSSMFALFAFIFSMTTVWGSILLLAIILLSLELLIEKIGLISKSYRPLLNMINGIRFNRSRDR